MNLMTRLICKKNYENLMIRVIFLLLIGCFYVLGFTNICYANKGNGQYKIYYYAEHTKTVSHASEGWCAELYTIHINDDYNYSNKYNKDIYCTEADLDMIGDDNHSDINYIEQVMPELPKFYYNPKDGLAHDHRCVSIVVDKHIKVHNTKCSWFTCFGDENYYLNGLIDLRNLDTSLLTTTESMFYGVEVATINISNMNTSNVANMSYMFGDKVGGGNPYIREIILDGINTSNVTTMEGMFEGLSMIKKFDLNSLNTKNVKNMEGMFSLQLSIEELDLKNFDTSNVVNMRGMFSECPKLKTIYVSDKFKVNYNSNPKNFDSMFMDSESIVGGNGTSWKTMYGHIAGETYVNPKIVQKFINENGDVADAYDFLFAHIDIESSPGFFTDASKRIKTNKKKNDVGEINDQENKNKENSKNETIKGIDETTKSIEEMPETTIKREYISKPKETKKAKTKQEVKFYKDNPIDFADVTKGEDFTIDSFFWPEDEKIELNVQDNVSYYFKAKYLFKKTEAFDMQLIKWGDSTIDVAIAQDGENAIAFPMYISDNKKPIYDTWTEISSNVMRKPFNTESIFINKCISLDCQISDKKNGDIEYEVKAVSNNDNSVTWNVYDHKGVTLLATVSIKDLTFYPSTYTKELIDFTNNGNTEKHSAKSNIVSAINNKFMLKYGTTYYFKIVRNRVLSNNCTSTSEYMLVSGDNRNSRANISNSNYPVRDSKLLDGYISLGYYSHYFKRDKKALVNPVVNWNANVVTISDDKGVVATDTIQSFLICIVNDIKK